VSGSTVTVSAVDAGAAANGRTIVVDSTQTGTVAATGSIVVENGGNDTQYVDAIQVSHPSGLVNIMSTSCSDGGWGSNVSISGSGSYGDRIRANSGTNNGAERAAMAAAIAACINQGGSGFSASSSGNTVTVRAPTIDGSLMNERSIAVIESEGSYSTVAFSGGQSSGAVIATSGSMAGGSDLATGDLPMRLGVGRFSRVDIDPNNNIYPKAAGRFDCAGATCTYAEEMTNFANWYAYYRTRMQMMKSAAGRAFVPIDDTYRVGFITINPQSPVAASRYLRIQNYDATHKGNWYTKFYQQAPSGGTPLREALSRVGRLYAGRFDGINSGIPSADDPMEVSCQPNFAILSTDGYWTTVGSSGNKVDGTAMTQQDDANVGPYSLRSDGVYDGKPPSATVGLADTALYYYQNDLRPAGSTNAASVDVSANNVPTTQNDFAAHQHMTTFTLGLGLDGTLTYRNDYQTAGSGDFLAIKQGTLNWPNPVANAPQALDDLWHAAVNGRGVFFSASNPQELANSLTDTLDALKTRRRRPRTCSRWRATTSPSPHSTRRRTGSAT
jgi:type IV pilus assembly protein PilY1